MAETAEVKEVTLLHILNLVSRRRKAKVTLNFPSIAFYNEATSQFSDKAINLSIEEWMKSQRQAWQSTKDLVALHENHEQALLLANTLAIVTIAGDTMTIAEAIALRKSRKETIDRLIDGLSKVVTVASGMARQLDALLEQATATARTQYIGANKNPTAESLRVVENSIQGYKYVIQEPIDYAKEIEQLKKQRDTVASEFDVALQIASAKLTLKIDARGFVDLTELRERLRKQ